MLIPRNTDPPPISPDCCRCRPKSRGSRSLRGSRARGRSAAKRLNREREYGFLCGCSFSGIRQPYQEATASRPPVGAIHESPVSYIMLQTRQRNRRPRTSLNIYEDDGEKTNISPSSFYIFQEEKLLFLKSYYGRIYQQHE